MLEEQEAPDKAFKWIGPVRFLMVLKTGLIIFLSTVMLFGFSVSSSSWASCGASQCPVDMTKGECPRKGSVSLGYQFEYVEQDQHRVGTGSASFREIQGHHDEEFTVNRGHRFNTSMGLTDRFSMDLQVPVISRSHAHVHQHEGEDILEAWDIHGIGDLLLRFRYVFWKPVSPRRPDLSILLGGEFPTGKQDRKNPEGDEAESGVQPGSHSYDLIIGLASLQRFNVPMLQGQQGVLPLHCNLIAQFNGHGKDGYRLGDTLQLNVGISYPLFLKLGLVTQLNFLLRDKDDKGNTGEEIQKTGGEYLYFSPGLEIQTGDNWKMFAMIQLPVHQRVNSIQTTSNYNVLMGITYRFQKGA